MHYTVSFTLSALLLSLVACSSESDNVGTTASDLVEDMADEEMADAEPSSTVDDVIDDEHPGMLCDEDRIRAIAERLVEKREMGAAEKGRRGDARPRKRRFMLTPRPLRRAFSRVLFSYDADADGLSDEELQAAVTDIAACCESRKATLLEKFDANNDGRLDRKERVALRSARRAHRQERRETRREEILSEYDANEDGVLDREERKQARADRLSDLGVDPRDGIDDEEKAIFRARVQERFQAYCAAD